MIGLSFVGRDKTYLKRDRPYETKPLAGTFEPESGLIRTRWFGPWRPASALPRSGPWRPVSALPRSGVWHGGGRSAIVARSLTR